MRIGSPSAYVSIHQQHTLACVSKYTLIFQLDRANLSGSKNKTKTQFPLALNRESQTLKRGESEGDLYNLQVVVVQGNLTKQEHYVTFLKPVAGPHWPLFDDHNVQWVSEESVLAQQANPPIILLQSTTYTYLTLGRWKRVRKRKKKHSSLFFSTVLLS